MTEEQLIQEYSDCIYPKIAKALISETKSMVIDKACYVYCYQCNLNYNVQFGKDCPNERKICSRLNMFRKAMEEK